MKKIYKLFSLLLITALLVSCGGDGTIKTDDKKPAEAIDINQFVKKPREVVVLDEDTLANEKVEKVMALAPEVVINGVKLTLPFTAEDFKANMPDYTVIEEGVHEVDPYLSYQSPDGKKVSVIYGVDDGLSRTFFNMKDGTEIVFPYGITQLDSYEDAFNKLDKEITNEGFHDIWKDQLLTFYAGEVEFYFQYSPEENRVVRVDTLKRTPEKLNEDMHVLASVALNDPTDTELDGVVTLEGKSFRLPITVGELKNALEGEFIEATAENFEKYLDPGANVAEYDLSLYGLIKTKNGEYPIFHQSLNMEDTTGSVEDNIVSSIRFDATSDFKLENDYYIINNENYKNSVEILKAANFKYQDDAVMMESMGGDSGLDIDFYGVGFYLDDNNRISIKRDLFTNNDLVFVSSAMKIGRQTEEELFDDYNDPAFYDNVKKEMEKYNTDAPKAP